jgi:hypothetical protein
MEEITRYTEVLNENNEWVKSDFINVKKGMTFRVFEADGTPVEYSGRMVFLAKGDADYTCEGLVGIAFE